METNGKASPVEGKVRFFDNWYDVTEKRPPVTNKQEVLCAWGPPWTYRVLVHWPDGIWTDADENPVGADEMPRLWRPISQPRT